MKNEINGCNRPNERAPSHELPCFGSSQSTSYGTPCVVNKTGTLCEKTHLQRHADGALGMGWTSWATCCQRFTPCTLLESSDRVWICSLEHWTNMVRLFVVCLKIVYPSMIVFPIQRYWKNIQILWMGIDIYIYICVRIYIYILLYIYIHMTYAMFRHTHFSGCGIWICSAN